MKVKTETQDSENQESQDVIINNTEGAEDGEVLNEECKWTLIFIFWCEISLKSHWNIRVPGQKSGL